MKYKQNKFSINRNIFFIGIGTNKCNFCELKNTGAKYPKCNIRFGYWLLVCLCLNKVDHFKRNKETSLIIPSSCPCCFGYWLIEIKLIIEILTHFLLPFGLNSISEEGLPRSPDSYRDSCFTLHGDCCISLLKVFSTPTSPQELP